MTAAAIPMARVHIGTDVGGTFTDLWAISDSGRQVVVKAPSTPDIITGILDALDLAAAEFGIPVEEVCALVERFGHGTTAGLNALLTDRAAKTAVITTAGFRDTLEIGRLKRQIAGLSELQLGDYTQRGRRPPVAARNLVFEVVERIAGIRPEHRANGQACRSERRTRRRKGRPARSLDH